MKKACFVALVTCVFVSTSLACGKERWAVKVLGDQDIGTINPSSTLCGDNKTIHDFSPEAAGLELVLVRQLRGPHLSR